MLPKIAHYAGFQSYGDLAYPSLKAGKKELESNTIYQETVRKDDDLKLYNNTNRWQTLYDQNLSKTAQPEHYQNTLRVNKHQIEKPLLTAGKLSTLTDTHILRRTVSEKAATDTFNADNKGMKLYSQTVSSLKRAQEDEQVEVQAGSSSEGFKTLEAGKPDDYELLQTGVEHWKTTYVASIKDPYTISRSTRPEWSLNKDPYTVEGGPRATDYKGQFGERGVNPIEKLSRTVHMPPVPKSHETLLLGTTKSTYHIPGYTGHLPKSLVVPDTWDQAHGVNSRATILKQNITENYQTRVPGYSGHRPSNAVNDRGTLRQLCFSTAGEKFY